MVNYLASTYEYHPSNILGHLNRHEANLVNLNNGLVQYGEKMTIANNLLTRHGDRLAANEDVTAQVKQSVAKMLAEREQLAKQIKAVTEHAASVKRTLENEVKSLLDRLLVAEESNQQQQERLEDDFRTVHTKLQTLQKKQEQDHDSLYSKIASQQEMLEANTEGMRDRIFEVREYAENSASKGLDAMTELKAEVASLKQTADLLLDERKESKHTDSTPVSEHTTGTSHTANGTSPSDLKIQGRANASKASNGIPLGILSKNKSFTTKADTFQRSVDISNPTPLAKANTPQSPTKTAPPKEPKTELEPEPIIRPSKRGTPFSISSDSNDNEVSRAPARKRTKKESEKNRKLKAPTRAPVIEDSDEDVGPVAPARRQAKHPGKVPRANVGTI